MKFRRNTDRIELFHAVTVEIEDNHDIRLKPSRSLRFSSDRRWIGHPRLRKNSGETAGNRRLGPWIIIHLVTNFELVTRMKVWQSRF